MSHINLGSTQHIELGDGNDSYSKFGFGNVLVEGGEGDDTVHGGSGFDTIFGNEDDDRLFGQDGNDRVYGDDGDDYVNGGNGNDYIAGGEGEDTLFGGRGNDVIVADDGDDTIIFNGSLLDVTVEADGDLIISTITQLQGTSLGGAPLPFSGVTETTSDVVVDASSGDIFVFNGVEVTYDDLVAMA